MPSHFGMQWQTASGCTCNVLPSPIECAKMQPNPVEVLNLDSDSTTLSNKKRTPPIWSTNITTINHELDKNMTIMDICIKKYFQVPWLNDNYHTLKVFLEQY